MIKIHKKLKTEKTKIPKAPHTPLGGRTRSLSPRKYKPSYGNCSNVGSCLPHHKCKSSSYTL